MRGKWLSPYGDESKKVETGRELPCLYAGYACTDETIPIEALSVAGCLPLREAKSYHQGEFAMTILNLTQHQATPEQVSAGVVEPRLKSEVVVALTFESLPDLNEIKHRALKLGMIATASGCSEAMIGGAPYLMRPLEEELLRRDITPLYAFSIRESQEETLPDGSIRKVQVFRHAGWVVAD